MKIIKPIVFQNYGFSRATPATNYDSTGTLVTAGIDVLRLGYDSDTLEFLGPIIEGQSTNIVLKSLDFTDDVWVKAPSLDIETSLTEVAPDGSVGDVNYTVISPADSSLYQFLPEFFEPTRICFSVFVKIQTPSIGPNLSAIRLSLTSPDHPTITGVINISNEAALESWTSIQKLQNGWYRVAIYGDIVATASERVIIQPLFSTEFYLWGAQCEVLVAPATLPTSFIYTDATAETRAADIQSSPPSLVLSNVDENDHPDWDDEEAYIAGEQVIVRGDYHRVYEALGPSTDSFPPDNPEDWLDQGATNRWRMWDMAVGSEKQTVSNSSDGSVEVLVDLNQPVSSVVLLNMDGVDVEVTMRDSGGNEVYNHYEILMQPSPADWWSYFFAPRRRAKMLVLTDLPPVRPSTIEMTLNGGSDDARIGKMIVGQGFDIGCARYGTSVGILDFSRKERDPFGNNFVLERRYIDRAEFDIQVPTPRVDEVKELLAELRATPVVYVGKETFQSTVIFGFFRDFSIILSGPKQSDCSMEVEGI